MTRRQSHKGRKGIDLRSRASLAAVVVALSFGGLAARLWFLQIGQGAVFRDRSDHNRLKTVYIPPPRGVMTDRHGEELVSNRPSFNIEFIKEDAPNPSDVLRELGDLLGNGLNLRSCLKMYRAMSLLGSRRTVMCFREFSCRSRRSGGIPIMRWLLILWGIFERQPKHS
jgi:hypothetical protein